MRSSSMAIAFRCACKMAQATLKTRKGLDWTAKFGAIARAAGKLAGRRSSMARSSPSTKTARPDFAALQAALSEGKTDDLVFFAFDLLFEGGEDLRALPLSERKAAPADNAARAQGEDARSFALSSISRPAATRSCAPPAGFRSKASCRREPMRRTSPAAAETGRRPSAAQGHEVVIGGWTHDQRQFPLSAGWRSSRRALRLCRPRRHGLRRSRRSGSCCRG